MMTNAPYIKSNTGR